MKPGFRIPALIAFGTVIAVAVFFQNCGVSGENTGLGSLGPAPHSDGSTGELTTGTTTGTTTAGTTSSGSSTSSGSTTGSSSSGSTTGTEPVATAFGGIYNVAYNGCKYTNPYTNACSCPSGFTTHILSIGNANTYFYCYNGANAQDGFGGMFNLSYSSSINNCVGDPNGAQVNPLTGNCNCPAGYEIKKMNYSWHYCYKQSLGRFGGMFYPSYSAQVGNCANDPNGSLVNPYTNECSCPDGFTTTRFETDAYYCYKP